MSIRGQKCRLPGSPPINLREAGKAAETATEHGNSVRTQATYGGHNPETGLPYRIAKAISEGANIALPHELAIRKSRIGKGPSLSRRFLAVNKRCARAANAQLLHPKLKCGALDSKTSSRSVWPRYKPIASFEGAQDLSPLGLL